MAQLPTASFQITCHWQLNDSSALGSANVFSVVDVYFQLKDSALRCHTKSPETVVIDDLEYDHNLNNGRAVLEKLLSSVRKLLYDFSAKLDVKLILPCHTGEM